MTNIQNDLRCQLMNALYHDNFSTIDELLEKDVNINLPYNHNGWTPFMWVCKEHCNPEVIAKFLKHGAKLDRVNKQGQTALHIMAAHRSSFDCLSLLIDAGADVNAQDVQGNTPLMIAAAHPQVAMRYDVVWNLFLKSDDSVRNHEGLSAYDIAKANPAFDDDEILEIMEKASHD